MNNFDKNQFSFLVTCVGAYDDSGLGTGGFVCVHRGKISVIDKLDSTGLTRSGETIYRFVRQMKAIIGYGPNGIYFLLRVPDLKDVHDIQATEDGFLCASTGHNELVWLDPFGRVVRTWRAEGENDAWHLNCLDTHNGQTYASAFGEFKTHREWNGKADGTGFIINIATGNKEIRNLTGPHSPRFLDGKWFVCESHINTLTIVGPDDSLNRIELQGFTRGLAYTDEYIFVGESQNRKTTSGADNSCIAVLDRRTLEVVDRIQIPFPEIYEIVIIPDKIGENLMTAPDKFRFEFNAQRILFLEQQIERLQAETFQLQSESGGFKKWVKNIFFRAVRRKQ